MPITLNDKSILDKLLLLLSMFDMGAVNTRTNQDLLRRITLSLPPDKIRGKFSVAQIERSWKKLESQGLIGKVHYSGWQINKDIDDLQLLVTFAKQETDLLTAIHHYFYEVLQGYYWVYNKDNQARDMFHYFKLSLVLDDLEGHQFVTTWAFQRAKDPQIIAKLNEMGTEMLMESVSTQPLLGPQLIAIILNNHIVESIRYLKGIPVELEKLAVQTIQEKKLNQEYLLSSCSFFF